MKGRTFEDGSIRNSLLAGTRASCASVGIAGKVSTDRRVQDQGVLVEVLADIASLRAEERYRRGPGVGIRVLRLDVGRNLSAREEPHLDTLVVPQMRKDTTSNHVERLSVASLVHIGERTTPVVASGAGASVVDDVGFQAEFPSGECAAFTRVERVLVGGLFMDTLEDIDLSTIRPVGAD